MFQPNVRPTAARVPATRSARSVVVVGGCPDRVQNLQDLLVDTSGYDVIVVESIARGYSRIRQVVPDFVIVVHDINDLAACQLLSMLKLDRELSRIPLLTCAVQRDNRDLEREIVELEEEIEHGSVEGPMH